METQVWTTLLQRQQEAFRGEDEQLVAPTHTQKLQ